MLKVRKPTLDLLRDWQGRSEEERQRSLGLFRPEILATFDLTKALAFFEGDEPVAVCGVDVIRVWDIGHVWMMTAPAFNRHAHEMVRLGRCLIPFTCAMTGFRALATYVLHGDQQAMRFAQLIGFAGVEPNPALVDFGAVGVMETLYLKNNEVQQ